MPRKRHKRCFYFLYWPNTCDRHREIPSVRKLIYHSFKIICETEWMVYETLLLIFHSEIAESTDWVKTEGVFLSFRKLHIFVGKFADWGKFLGCSVLVPEVFFSACTTISRSVDLSLRFYMIFREIWFVHWSLFLLGFNFVSAECHIQRWSVILTFFLDVIISFNIFSWVPGHYSPWCATQAMLKFVTLRSGVRLSANLNLKVNLFSSPICAESKFLILTGISWQRLGFSSWRL